MLTDTCATCALPVRYVRLVGRGFWEHEQGGEHGHTAIAIGSMSGALLTDTLNEALSAVYAAGQADPYDATAYAAAQARYQRLERERQHRVMVAMREDGANG